MAKDPIAHAEAVIAKADDLDARIGKKTEEVIRGLVESDKRNKRIQRSLGAILVVLFIVVVAGIFSIVKIMDNAATIQASCEASNRASAREIQIWEHIVNLPPPPDETDAQKQQKVDFLKFIQDTFPPTDCHQTKVLP